MDTSDKFDAAFRKLQQEMHADARLLDEKKKDLKDTQDESVRLRNEIIKAKQEILSKEQKIKENETKKVRLDQEIKKLQDKQRKEHMELSKAEIENRQRLTQHGVNIPQKPSF